MSVKIHDVLCVCHVIERESRVEPIEVLADRVMEVVGR